MCLGNRAESSAHYINSQLVSLYENAKRCTEKHGTGLKPTLSAVEYATALFEYYGPGKHSRYQPSRRDLSFFATFGRPRVEFVCNHEVILFLELHDGHYNLDTNKPTPKHDLHETIKNYTVAFRINFSTHSIDKFVCSAIGNSESYTMNIHVLDVDSAAFVPELSDLPDITSVTDERSFYTKERKVTALTHYLTKFYLQTFKRAGYHVLYSLPDFDNLTITTAHIDYSVISKRTLSTDNLYGVSVEDINTYLRGLWLQAAAHIDEEGFSFDHSAVTKHFLAEIRTVWTDTVEDIHAHIYFGPLQIQPLCKREVVLYMNLQDIHVHIGGGFGSHPHHELKDWKIAFIVDIRYEETTDGVTKRIILDLSSSRYCEHLSIFGEFFDVELLNRIKSTLVRYLTTHYLKIVETTQNTVIFHHDSSVHTHHHSAQIDNELSESYDLEVDQHGHGHQISQHGHHGSQHGSTHLVGSGVEIVDESDDFHVHDCTCEDEASCGHTDGVRWGILQKSLLTKTATFDFDMVSAVTQGSINVNYKAVWDEARRRIRKLGEKKRTWESLELETETCIADYSFVHPAHGEEVFFASSFAPPKVQLVCKEGSHSAIFYLHLAEGYLKTLGSGKSLQPGSHAHPFHHWRLAFEVDLKLIDATKETLSEVVLKRLGGHSPSAFKQLVIDLSAAKFNLSLSTIPGLLDGHDYRSIRSRREALMYYIQTCYFPVFQRARHQVLYTIPTFDKDGSGKFRHLLTSLTFEIVPFDYGKGLVLEGLYGRHRAIYERNTIVFLGVFGGKSLPTGRPPRGINWVAGLGKEVPHGSVCLSRKVFLEERILSLLELINRDTTIVPSFSGVDEGEWILKLTTWGKHDVKKNRACHWKEITKGDESLGFEWKNRDEWRYEHEGDLDGNGLYVVNCTTRNVLSIPTSRKGTSAIHIKGNMTLSLRYVGVDKEWNSEMAATWTAGIMFASDARGLRVNIAPAKITPNFHETHSEGALGHSTHEEAFKHLKQEFPQVINFESVVEDLKDNFEGCWAGLHLNTRELIVSHPVFNKRGDLLLDLSVRSATSSIDEKINGHGVALPLSGHGLRGNGASEGFFRHIVHKAEDFVSSVVTPPPTYAPPFSLVQNKSSVKSSSFVRSKSAVEVAGEVDEFESAAEEEDL